MKNRLTDFLFFPCYEKDWDCNKSQRKQESLAHSKPRKQGHPFSLSVLKIHEPCLYSAVNAVVACLFTVSAPQAEGSSLPVYTKVEWDCSESSLSNKKQFRIKVPSSWRFPLSLQLNCTCFSPGPKEKVFLTPSQWQYVKYHLHRASVLRLACTMLKGTVSYESWPGKSPLCSS